MVLCCFCQFQVVWSVLFVCLKLLQAVAGGCWLLQVVSGVSEVVSRLRVVFVRKRLF